MLQDYPNANSIWRKLNLDQDSNFMFDDGIPWLKSQIQSQHGLLVAYVFDYLEISQCGGLRGHQVVDMVHNQLD